MFTPEWEETGVKRDDRGRHRVVTLEKCERRSGIPLTFLALAFLVAYAWPILDPGLPVNLRAFLEALSWTVWGAFSVDLAARVALAEHRRRYLLTHWYDVALVVLPCCGRCGCSDWSR